MATAKIASVKPTIDALVKLRDEKRKGMAGGDEQAARMAFKISSDLACLERVEKRISKDFYSGKGEE